jgi:hypothetical protein
MSSPNALGGAFKYEFLMQARRRSVWIGFGVISILLALYLSSLLKPYQDGARLVTYSPHDALLFWVQGCVFLLTPIAGLLLADRTPRDQSTRARDLLVALPASTWSRLLGKYVGSVAATCLPIISIYAIGVGILVIHWGDARILPMALAAGGLLLVPPLLFVGAFSVACTTILWMPLYQFLFIGYWLWVSLNPTQAIPTLDGTLLSPQENDVYTAIFRFFGSNDGFYSSATILQALANIVVLLACGALALFAAGHLLRWRIERG